ncbi:MAG: hypothetical protein IT236_11010 [Bacteroidia bacterium]|nr:hypothetical protein [Bacteroidia bacterium]
MTNSKIHLINLGILLVYMVGLTLAFKGAVLLLSIVPIGIHVFINFLLFLLYLKKDRPLSYTFLLSALIVLLVGFSGCWGLTNLSGGLKI